MSEKLPVVHLCEGETEYHVSIYDSGIKGHCTHDVDVSEAFEAGRRQGAIEELEALYKGVVVLHDKNRMVHLSEVLELLKKPQQRAKELKDGTL